jgi:medium-chain acyl-[acyl-carrier-protein] hydrolase
MLPAPDPAAPLRLFCFHHAGAGASTFQPWLAPLASAGVAVCAVQLPGRENRFLEPAHSRLEPLIDALMPQLAPHLDRPFALFGHSMGALVAFEVTRALRATGAPMPAHLHVAGRIAPQLTDPRRRLHNLSDQELLEELRALGGVPRAVLEDRDLMALALPVLRADLAVNETYRHTPAAPLRVPITAFGGTHDPKVREDELRAWERQTYAGFRTCIVPGDHFFVSSALPLVLRDLIADLRVAA